jgi:ubiquinone/menaquinone biosynthesis C-methylase UbiE
LDIHPHDTYISKFVIYRLDITMTAHTPSQETWQELPLSIAPSIASHSLSTPESLQIEIDQTTHRLELLNFFQIPAASSILEIGCGQGTCTVVLGHVVGEDGHVDAIDPAPLDYGAPYTLGQAQEHIARGALGGRVKFWQAQLEDFLNKTRDKKWDYAVFVHCLWYLDAPETLTRMLKALKGRVNRVCIAEYAMKASERTAIPHVLAALTRATLEAQRPDSEANIRCLFSPNEIKNIAENSGWKVERETEIVPQEGLQDGGWEVGDVKSKSFLDDIEQHAADIKMKIVVRSGREAVLRAVEGLNGRKVQTMDVWAAMLSE